MKNFKDEVDRLVGEYINELQEENKKLSEDHRIYEEGLEKKIVELQEENKKIKEDSKTLESAIGDVVRENRRLKEEKELLKQCLDKLMFDADVVNVKIHGELGDYVYVRSDRQFKLNVKE